MMTRALVVHPHGTARLVDVEPVPGTGSLLPWLQQLVGGYIEGVSPGAAAPDREPAWHAYVNEEGKILGLPINEQATGIAAVFGWPGLPHDVLNGTVVFLGDGPDGGEGDVPDYLVDAARAARLLPFAVRVFHNTARDANDRPIAMLDGYAAAHVVTCVAECTVDSTGATDLAVCDEAYRLFNVGDDPEFGTPDPEAVEYRARRNRSLSVGDVVSVDGRHYACDPRGWRAIDPPRVDTVTTYGTTPLGDEAAGQ
jgi:hypothetical protein